MNKMLSLAVLAIAIPPVLGTWLWLPTPLTRDLRLATELGLDEDILWNDPLAFQTLVARTIDSSIQPEYVEIPIDHDDPSVGTYRNRFWVNEEFYVPGAPVVVYDIGENSAEYSVGLLANASSWLGVLLREVGAMGVVWEHRYYGESLPFPVSQDTPVEHLQYLTTRQALADIPSFAANFARDSYPDIDLTPTGTPWVMIGGSYPGTRAAFARNQYPETIFAAYASSAPVQAQLDIGVYYEQIYRALVANGYGNCTKDIQAALGYIDSTISHAATAGALKRLFLGAGGERNNNADFTSALSALYGPFQSRGLGAGNQSLDSFCNYLELDPATNRPAGPDGLAPVYGGKYVAERWASFPPFIPLVNRVFGTNCGGLDATRPATCEFGTRASHPDLISWTWQYCTEWGFYHANNFGPHALLSRFQTLEYQQELCDRQFPGTGMRPRTEALNGEFGGWTIRPSNVYFTAGEFDPWRPLSVLSGEDWAQGVNYTTDIPACGVSDEKNLFGYLMKNAVHCPDFKPTPDAAVARGYFIQALKQWLPCFGARQ